MHLCVNQSILQDFDLRIFWKQDMLIMVSSAFWSETLTIYVVMYYRNEIKLWVLTRKCEKNTQGQDHSKFTCNAKMRWTVIFFSTTLVA
jgi:hypothetical protein